METEKEKIASEALLASDSRWSVVGTCLKLENLALQLESLFLLALSQSKGPGLWAFSSPATWLPQLLFTNR